MASRQRLKPEDWIRAALEGLLKEGPSGVKVAHLARALGVTPSSFYWHFKDRHQFRDRVLQYWMKQMIARAGDAALRAGSGPAQIRALPGILVKQGLPSYDLAMRRWAVADPVVAKAVEKADELRSRRVAAMFQEAGFDDQDALECARLVGWAFFGSTGADPEIRTRAIQKLIDLLLRNAPRKPSPRRKTARAAPHPGSRRG